MEKVLAKGQRVSRVSTERQKLLPEGIGEGAHTIKMCQSLELLESSIIGVRDHKSLIKAQKATYWRKRC